MKKILFLLGMSLFFISSVVFVYAQSGADGLGKIPSPSPKSKPKPKNNPPSLMDKLIGKWELEGWHHYQLKEVNLSHIVFNKNNGVLYESKNTVCQTFTYTLTKDILTISNKSVKSCGTGFKTEKWKISFIKNQSQNQLIMLLIDNKGNPVEDKDETIFKYYWKRR